MVMGSSVDWTQVLIALIAGAPAILAAVFAFLVHRQVATPSGDRIGAVMERTHDLSSADLALTKQVHDKVSQPRAHRSTDETDAGAT